MILLTVGVYVMGLGHYRVRGRFRIAFRHSGGCCCCAIEVVERSNMNRFESALMRGWRGSSPFK